MKLKYLLACFFMLSAVSMVWAQNTLNGKITEKDKNGKLQPLPYANIHWLGTQEGTVANEAGQFILNRISDRSTQLVVSFVGYLNDTISVSPGQSRVDVTLRTGAELDAVEIKQRMAGNFISSIKPIKTEVITTAGLQKLACCNLSESFENNATVDVGFSDAVTGARQIQMLGLAGIYSQLMVENIPFTRGLGSAFGLTYIPGTWMESIQVSKGTSSVINGYESTTGQINAEFRKPFNTDKFFLNLYGNLEGRMELNSHASHVIKEDVLSTMVLAHASTQVKKVDVNGDGFLDQPLTRQINVSNRWSYEKHGVTESKFGINFLMDEREGGQLTNLNANDAINNGNYVMKLKTRRAQAYDKTGFIFNKFENTSLGLIFSGLYHEQESVFGRTDYNARQLGFYGNAIFQSQIGSEAHTYNVGTSMMYDDYEEAYGDTTFNRVESVPGVFGQYTFNPSEKLSIIVGIRADHHNKYGTIVTPRIHFKVNIFEHMVMRGSAGKGYRSASVLAENTGMLVSARQLVFREDFDMEEAWNYGINLTQTIPITEERSIVLSADYYRTDFINQIIIDLDQAFDRIEIYNLEGKSYSNSLQFNAEMALFEGFDVTAAYRLNDVRVTTAGQLRERPLVSRHKGLLAMSYATRFEKWKFDLTGQYNGKTRLPLGVPLLEAAGYGEFSPDYFTVHTQITRKFKKWDAYAGVENLTNFTQHHPVLLPESPFESGFDAGMIWGPLMGRMFYVGIRYALK
ncbi:MAG: TonB-dependent receptor [Lentimicrobium sp.]|jgi:outer membrane receptor for ferrienterochelin and colicin|nr:TonB-dependent receptor [Lentimicrobium sp.]